jgi:hypothetical protein
MYVPQPFASINQGMLHQVRFLVWIARETQIKRIVDWAAFWRQTWECPCEPLLVLPDGFPEPYPPVEPEESSPASDEPPAPSNALFPEFL